MDGTKWKGHSPVFHEGESVLMEGVIVPTRHDHEAAINNEIASGGVGVGVGGEFRGTMGGGATVGGGLDMVMRMGKGSGDFDTEENGQQEKQQQLNNGQQQQQQQQHQQHQQEGQGGREAGGLAGDDETGHAWRRHVQTQEKAKAAAAALAADGDCWMEVRAMARRPIGFIQK